MLIIDVSVTHFYEFEGRIDKFYNNKSPELNKKLEKITILVFFGVFIHNIPEGMATFVSSLKDIELGMMLAIAIAMHNIPEGIAVSIPIYTCTKSRKKAIFWSFMSGMSEFIGVLIVGLILFPFINNNLLGAILAIVAGLMVYISLDELLPVAHNTKTEHISIIGVILGMGIMAISLIII